MNIVSVEKVRDIVGDFCANHADSGPVLLALLAKIEEQGSAARVGVTNASKIVGISRDTLNAWRSRGVGPPYFQLGGKGATVQYSPHEILEWVDSCHHPLPGLVKKTSTSVSNSSSSDRCEPGTGDLA